MTTVTPGGLADGKLLSGDEIVSVMGQKCIGMAHSEFVNVCCTAQYELCLGVRIPDPDDEIYTGDICAAPPLATTVTTPTGATWLQKAY